MTPALQQILHEITVRLTKLEKSFLQPEQDCTRSHPHEEMNKECELRTEIARLRNQLAQPEQEPVAWGFQNSAITGSNRWMMLREEIPANDQYGGALWTPLYTTPPQRKPLTDEELRVIENKINPTMRWRSSDEEGITLYPQEYYELVRAIEAAHGIKD